jgi:hypothetical protein
MRLWSVHPRLLDAKGLVALWRETLLAKHVLLGKTKGYRHHPQLLRFKECKRPVDAINQYLATIYETAVDRGYHFDPRKVDWQFKSTKIDIPRGQVVFETEHLLKKLKLRDQEQHKIVLRQKRLSCHPIFRVVPGGVADWEIM